MVESIIEVEKRMVLLLEAVVTLAMVMTQAGHRMQVEVMVYRKEVMKIGKHEKQPEHRTRFLARFVVSCWLKQNVRNENFVADEIRPWPEVVIESEKDEALPAMLVGVWEAEDCRSSSIPCEPDVVLAEELILLCERF